MSLEPLIGRPGTRRLRLGADRPLTLNRPDRAYLVLSGWVDLFTVPLREGELDGPRSHLARVAEGGLALGQAGTAEWTWIAVGQAGAELLELPTAELKRAPTELLAPMVEGWLVTLCSLLEPEHPDPVPSLLEPGQTQTTAGPVRVGQGTGWLRCSEGLICRRRQLELGDRTVGSRLVPSSKELWWQPLELAEIACCSTEEALSDEKGWAALSDLQGRLFQVAIEAALEQTAARTARLQDRPRRDRQQMAGSLHQMASVMPGSGFVTVPQVEHADPLLAAAALVGSAAGLEIRRPLGSHLETAEPVADIAHASRCRVRACELEGRWWRQDSGPLLAFLQDGTPVALLPSRPGRYELVDPSRHSRRPVDAAVASELQEQAWMFYRPLPDRPIGPFEVLKFGLSSVPGEMVTILWLGLGIGLLSLVMPVATGALVNSIIPSGNEHALGDLAFALLAATVGMGAFNLTRAIAVLRMEGRMDGAVQSAILDRVLRLPVPFFRRFSTGDLANRALGVNAIRSILSGATISTLMSGIFSLFSFALLFYYDWHLALLATGLVLFLCLQIVMVGVLVLRYQKPLMDLEGELSGRVYQLLSGIAKIRVAGAEARAFTQWAETFARQRELSFRNGLIGVNSGAFQSAYKILTTAALFAFIAWRGYDAMNTGHFLAFNAAFGQFLGALTSVSSTLTSILKVGPIMERARPILQSELEAEDQLPDAGLVRGRVRLNSVWFRYDDEAPWVLNDVSLEAQPGEFVAIVGPSGAGKSTLLRLLLGFDRPKRGTVMYDDQDLASVNLQSLRRQIGVVLQNGNLMPGDIYSNIVGSTGRSLEEAWEAARIAGIEDDIKAMPMGMHTVIPEGATTISGGQRQRLMIARAIVTKPRVLFFDEATSALDAQTQSQLTERISALNTTRVVIAHRLSTIRHAHRIYVLSNHRVVQCGTFEELLAQPGEFAELARRQMV